MMMFGTRITVNYPKIKKICFTKIHGQFTAIRVPQNKSACGHPYTISYSQANVIVVSNHQQWNSNFQQ